MLRLRRPLAILLASVAVTTLAQEADRPTPGMIAARSKPGSAADLTPTEPPPTGADPTFTPTWETQKNARTHLLSIPAPRGQIVDRNGKPLAQTRVSHNLAIAFPTPLKFNDREVLRFTGEQVALARSLTQRTIIVKSDQILKHYKNRGVLPMTIAQDLKPDEMEAFQAAKAKSLVLQPVYQRFYPNGSLAGHVLGYAGRAGRVATGPIENNETLWPNAEGREGLEQSFDSQLQGKFGQYNLSFDAAGKQASEQISIPPQPGYNVVTTLDENIQRLCEESLRKGTKRGAIVVLDPNTGDVLALASWPTINPNDFIPNISSEAFKALQDDPNIPLIPRAFRSSYPPGSVYKCFVGLAALTSGKVEPGDEFSCPPAFNVGNLTFRNWKKTHGGMLNFADALTQSCNTWFYQVGLRIGAQPIIDSSHQLGLGEKTGIPLNAEDPGRIPTNEYMQKVHKRNLLNGDVANLSIGQGDTLVTPLQMAQAMAALGNGGTLYQTRLVQQVQGIDGQIVTAYNVRAKSSTPIDPTAMKTIRRGMIQVVSSRSGTASRAAVPGFQVAGKTGTAQWGPKNKERTAAWFAGFVPAEEPKYAFAAVYEGEANNDDVHGGTQAAPLIGNVMRELFKDEKRETVAERKKRKAMEAGESGEEVDPMDEEDAEDRPMRRTRPRAEADEDEIAPPPPPPPRRERGGFWRRIFRN